MINVMGAAGDVKLPLASSNGSYVDPVPTSGYCDQMSPGSADQSTDDLSIESYSTLITPMSLRDALPITTTAALTVRRARRSAAEIISGVDDRLLVIVGPCSIHDVDGALEYGQRLSEVLDEFAGELHIVMRAYFEKPRTTVGWKGLINDPDIDGSFRINKGLTLARRILLDLNELEVPVGVEMLDTVTPQFLADLVSWGAIGARTTESQLHRELASGVSFPVGFKNGTSGNVQIAMDAIGAATAPHSFLGVDSAGRASICRTKGNQFCHPILRGGRDSPNYEPEYIYSTRKLIEQNKLKNTAIMIDCSHGNSRKNHANQSAVCKNVAEQVSSGDRSIIGVMIESNLVEGSQKVVKGQPLEYGKSITDACISFDDTIPLLQLLSNAVRHRRSESSRDFC